MSSLREKDLESRDRDAARPTLAQDTFGDAPSISNNDVQSESSSPPYPTFAGDISWSQRSWAYEFTPFRGMYFDLKRRLPFYASDWTDALHPNNWYKITESTVRIYFINLMPAIAYVLDMYHRTNGAYGVNEVILASALAAIVFSVFSVQPLTFVGVTGLINLVNYTQYNIVVGYYGLDQMDYLRVQAWSLIWSAGFHFLAGIFNVSDYTRFITDMTSETFGFYVGIVYIQKGIELLLLEFEPLPLNNATGWLSVTIAILFTVSVYFVTKVGATSFLPFKMRSFVSSFAFTAGIIFWTGFSHFPKNSLERVPIERLPITRAFFPTMDRSWFIDFWNIEAKWAFVGAPLGFLITLLFYFDHNVSSVMAQARQFPVKKPAGFHWDFFLLGITTLVSGFLGLPAPNGLVPQAPVHTESLSVYEQVNKPSDDESSPSNPSKRPRYLAQHIINTRVVEQRLSHLVIGLLTIGTMTRPLLVVLGTMPRAVFAGVFLLVGWGSIEGNGITKKTLAVFRDRRMGTEYDPLKVIRRKKIALYVGIQWLFFALTFAISQTIAAIGFPVLITLLIPFRYSIVPRWFSPIELAILDAPTAEADGVLASLGHESERVTGRGVKVAKDTGCAGTEWKNVKDDGSDSEYDDGLLNEFIDKEESDEKSNGNFGLRNRGTGKAQDRGNSGSRSSEVVTPNLASSVSGTANSSSPAISLKPAFFASNTSAGNDSQKMVPADSIPEQASSSYPPSSDKLYPTQGSDSKSTSLAPALAASTLPLSAATLACTSSEKDHTLKKKEEQEKKLLEKEEQKKEKEAKKTREKEEKKSQTQEKGTAKESKQHSLLSLFKTPLGGTGEQQKEKEVKTEEKGAEPDAAASYPPSSDKLYPIKEQKSISHQPEASTSASKDMNSPSESTSPSSTQKKGIFTSLFKTPLISNDEEQTKPQPQTSKTANTQEPEFKSRKLEISAPIPVENDEASKSSWPIPAAASTKTSRTSDEPPPVVPSNDQSTEALLSPRSKSRIMRVENPSRGPGSSVDPVQWRS